MLKFLYSASIIASNKAAFVAASNSNKFTDPVISIICVLIRAVMFTVVTSTTGVVKASVDVVISVVAFTSQCMPEYPVSNTSIHQYIQ